MKLYGAYGSNLNMEQMMYRCPSARPYGTCTIKGQKLVFRGSKTGSYLTIEPAEGYEVPIGLWYVDDKCEKALDRYEGFPVFYQKHDVDFGGRKGFIYVMVSGRPLGVPTKQYVRTCLDGYQDFGFDKGILMRAVREAKEENK